MARWLVIVSLDSFKTLKAGDVFGEGEFYFEINKQRLPNEGEIKLGKNEVFDPEPNPTFFFGLIETNKSEYKVKVKVYEKDPGMDDKFIDEKIKVPLQSGTKKIKLLNKKGTCQLNLTTTVKEAGNW